MALVQPRAPSFDISDPFTIQDSITLVLSYLKIPDLINLHLVNQSWAELLSLTDKTNNQGVEYYSECVLNQLKQIHNKLLQQVFPHLDSAFGQQFHNAQLSKCNKRHFIKYTMPLLGQISILVVHCVSDDKDEIEIDNVESTYDVHESLLKFIKYHNFMMKGDESHYTTTSLANGNNNNNSNNNNYNNNNNQKDDELEYKESNDDSIIKKLVKSEKLATFEKIRKIFWFMEQSMDNNPFILTLYKYTLGTFDYIRKNYNNYGSAVDDKPETNDSLLIVEFEKHCQNLIHFYGYWKLIGGYCNQWTNFYYLSILYCSNSDIAIQLISKIISNYDKVGIKDFNDDNDEKKQFNNQHGDERKENNTNNTLRMIFPTKSASILKQNIFKGSNGIAAQYFVEVLVICIKLILYQIKRQKSEDKEKAKEKFKDIKYMRDKNIISKLAIQRENDRIRNVFKVEKDIDKLVSIMVDLIDISQYYHERFYQFYTFFSSLIKYESNYSLMPNSIVKLNCKEYGKYKWIKTKIGKIIYNMDKDTKKAFVECVLTDKFGFGSGSGSRIKKRISIDDDNVIKPINNRFIYYFIVDRQLIVKLGHVFLQNDSPFNRGNLFGTNYTSLLVSLNWANIIDSSKTNHTQLISCLSQLMCYCYAPHQNRLTHGDDYEAEVNSNMNWKINKNHKNAFGIKLSANEMSLFHTGNVFRRLILSSWQNKSIVSNISKLICHWCKYSIVASLFVNKIVFEQLISSISREDVDRQLRYSWAPEDRNELLIAYAKDVETEKICLRLIQDIIGIDDILWRNRCNHFFYCNEVPLDEDDIEQGNYLEEVFEWGFDSYCSDADILSLVLCNLYGKRCINIVTFVINHMMRNDKRFCNFINEIRFEYNSRWPKSIDAMIKAKCKQFYRKIDKNCRDIFRWKV